jgi:hypothetical protein
VKQNQRTKDKYLINIGILTMKLNDLEQKNHAKKALKENYEVTFEVSSLDKANTKHMLNKVTKLITEARQSSNFYKNQTSSTYMKLVFMEQALSTHYKDLMNAPKPRIVFENEEVEKSQVILAAQDMIDTVQKMYEDVNDMMVKELPALVSSIQSEIGANESTEFNNQASEALRALNDSLLNSKNSLEGALGTITGQSGMDSFATDDSGMDELEPADDLGMDDGASDLDMDLDIEEPELPAVGGVGRAKR